jgi:hypothetical protein
MTLSPLALGSGLLLTLVFAATVINFALTIKQHLAAWLGKIITAKKPSQHPLTSIAPINYQLRAWQPALFLVSCYCLWLLGLTFFYYRFVPAPNLPIAASQTFRDWTDYIVYDLTDTKSYFSLARFGYLPVNPKHYSMLVFFPLYPFLLNLSAHLPGLNLINASYLLNIIFMTLTLTLLYQLLQQQFSAQISKLTLALLLLFPVSFFLFLPHPESLFLLLTTLTFWTLKRQRWHLAGGWAFLAALTRPQGFLLAVPIALNCFAPPETWRHPQRWFKACFYSLCPLLGLLVYLGLNYFIAGDPFAFLQRQNFSWGQQPFNIIDSFFLQAHLFSGAQSAAASFIRWGLQISLLALSFISIIYACRKKLPFDYICFALIYLIFSFSLRNTISGQRYMLVLWPIFIFQAHFLAHHRYLTLAYLIVLITLLPLAWYFYVFGAGYLVC